MIEQWRISQKINSNAWLSYKFIGCADVVKHWGQGQSNIVTSECEDRPMLCLSRRKTLRDKYISEKSWSPHRHLSSRTLRNQLIYSIMELIVVENVDNHPLATRRDGSSTWTIMWEVQQPSLDPSPDPLMHVWDILVVRTGVIRTGGMRMSVSRSSESIIYQTWDRLISFFMSWPFYVYIHIKYLCVYAYKIILIACVLRSQDEKLRS